MRYILGKHAMQYVEDYSIKEMGLPSLVLMERAALAVADAVAKRCQEHTRVLICCGVGNNGADGLAVARLLWQKNISVEVQVVGDLERSTQEFRTQFPITQGLGVSVGNLGLCAEYIKKEKYDIIVDALFGIGLSRPIHGEWRDWIEWINQSNAYVVSIDIPSGISADSGAVMGCAVRADLTVTFGYEKLGTAMYPGKDYAGEVQVCDIGLIETDFYGPHACTYEPSELKYLPERAARSHKGDFGKVLVIAGSENMSGAAYLCAKAAYRMGAGLVRILTPEENRIILQTSLPEAILSTYQTDPFTVNGLNEVLSWPNAIVIGPGLGKGDHVRSLVSYVLQYSLVPIVIDADALNVIADNPNMTMHLSYKRVIVTPHIMEMSRLTGRRWQEIRETMVETAVNYSRKTGAVCVLKDARTVVTDGRDDERFYLNTSGNCGMATAGSGDVLSGILGALLAVNMLPMYAAMLGVYIHGLAGDEAAKRLGTYAMMAGDIIESISQVTQMRER